MEYWIIKDDKQCGPYTLEQLMEMDLHQGTPVWRQGLADWLPLSKVQEMDMSQVETIVKETIIETAPATAKTTVLCAPVGDIPTGYVAVTTDGVPKCPPAYLVWSIIATVLFFLPLGVCAIFSSTKVKKYYEAGEYDKASRMSERTALFVILSLVVFLIWMPFQVVISMF